MARLRWRLLGRKKKGETGKGVHKQIWSVSVSVGGVEVPVQVERVKDRRDQEPRL